MQINQAEQRHVRDICAISGKLLHTQNQDGNGFLVRPLDETMVSDSIGEFTVLEQDGQVAAYLWVTPGYPKLRQEHTTFFEDVNLTNVKYVKQVAVHPDYARQGLASRLYRYLFRQFPDATVMACIAVLPLINQPSIAFHERLDFRKVGHLVLHDYLGFDKYETDVFSR